MIIVLIFLLNLEKSSTKSCLKESFSWEKYEIVENRWILSSANELYIAKAILYNQLILVHSGKIFHCLAVKADFLKFVEVIHRLKSALMTVEFSEMGETLHFY